MADAREGGFRALERGLAVIRFFTERERPATIADVARGAALDRAVARRILLALKSLGYVGEEDGRYFLLPSVLELGYAYLSSDPLPSIADARLRPLSEQLQESCSLGVLGADGRVTYLATIQFKRIAGPTLTVGTSADPHLTSVGRVLLAYLDETRRDEIVGRLDFTPVTSHTSTDPGAFLSELEDVRLQGWSMIDQELELGVLALGVPVRDRSGRVVAAANVTSHTSRRSRDEFLLAAMGPLREAARQIEADLRHAGR